MNTRDAMQALLDGKKLRRKSWNQAAYWVELRNGRLQDSVGRPVSVEFCDGSKIPDLDFELYEESNPHTKGTFAWAREEAKRGKRVKRPTHTESYGPAWSMQSRPVFEKVCWATEHIDATDWQHANGPTPPDRGEMYED